LYRDAKTAERKINAFWLFHTHIVDGLAGIHRIDDRDPHTGDVAEKHIARECGTSLEHPSWLCRRQFGSKIRSLADKLLSYGFHGGPLLQDLKLEAEDLLREQLRMCTAGLYNFLLKEIDALAKPAALGPKR
jgi:hypothetical protein